MVFIIKVSNMRTPRFSSLLRAERGRGFQKTVSSEDARRSREETTIQLRKQKKNSQMAKRRNQTSVATFDLAASQGKAVGHSPKSVSMMIKQQLHLFQKHQQDPNAVSEEELHISIRTLRRLLSQTVPSPCQEVVESGIIFHMVRISVLHQASCGSQLRCSILHECLWILINISSDNYTKQVAESGIVPLAATMMCSHEDPNVREQAAWCLGNIAGHSSEYRDTCLATPHLMDGLLRNLESPSTSSLLGIVCWLASNLLRGQPSICASVTIPVTKALQTNLHEALSVINSDPRLSDVLLDILWALSYLSEGDKDCIQKFVDTGIVNSLMRVVGYYSNNAALLPLSLLRTMGNIVAGSVQQTQAVLDSGFARHLISLLGSPSKEIQRESAWMCANIAAGTSSQLNELLNERVNGGILWSLCQLAVKGKTYAIRKEAQFAICEIVKTGDKHHTELVVGADGIESLVEGCLKAKHADLRVLRFCLETFKEIFDHGVASGQDGYYLECFQSCGGLDRLVELQDHEDQKVYDLCIEILDSHFDENVDENIDTRVLDDGTHSFGIAKNLFPTGNFGKAERPQFAAAITDSHRNAW